MDNAGRIKCLPVTNRERNGSPSDGTKQPSKNEKSGKGVANGKQKEQGNELKLVMEPQNTSPTKYFDINGMPLRKALEDDGSIEQQTTDGGDQGKKGNKVSIKCCNCGKTFTSRATYELHYRTSYDQDPVYECTVCGKRIKQYRAYQLHTYRHSANQRFTCPDCSKTFHQKSDLTRHQNIHQPNNGSGSSKSGAVKLQVIPCPRCDDIFATQAEFKEHSRKLHRTPKQLVECPDCGKSLSTGSLYSHRKIHSESPKFSCPECGRTFVQKINLIQHHKTHLGDRPFQCDQCDKAFCERAHLQRHLNYHSQERPFRCELCGKCYKTERCLKVHSAVHNNERPFVCPECNKGFLSSSKLRQHSNIHSGLRPFKCKYCTRDFTNFPNWLKHIRRRHKVDHRTGEKLDSVPKFMTKKKSGEGASVRKKELSESTGSTKKRPVKIPLPDVLKDDESLPYFSESSNIDLNLVCKEDLLQPLADEIVDIFQCLPSDESKLSIPEPLEQLCSGSLRNLVDEPVDRVSNGGSSSSSSRVVPLEVDCDFSVRSPIDHQLDISTDLIKHELPSNALSSCEKDTFIGPLLYDAQLSMLPMMASLCGSDEPKQFRLINPHFIHLSSSPSFLAGNSRAPPSPEDGDQSAVPVSIGE
ncbi:zinc finger protein 484-like [Anopheles maculipalpis]|uniref:zinc finger protein 484-like n=1 Tax=Anopheles maculipalpis TaxID=1496333 RepID=UPI002158D93F|nr:zinc finger protein 484-like [Anopheles maculipalpis]